jgi:hypothetical protein
MLAVIQNYTPHWISTNDIKELWHQSQHFLVKHLLSNKTFQHLAIKFTYNMIDGVKQENY